MTNTHSHSIFLQSNIYCYCKRCLKGKTMRKKWKMQYCLIFTKLIRQILSFLWVSLKFRRLKPFSHQKKYLQFSNYKKETYILTCKLVTTILAFFFKPLTIMFREKWHGYFKWNFPFYCVLKRCWCVCFDSLIHRHMFFGKHILNPF